MLYIVPTPIGNLGDISQRAKDIISSCDFIIAENPAQTHKLLQLLGLPKKEVVQFAEHNERLVLPKLVDRLEKQTACLVSDAGMPGISDPGFRLVRACRGENIEVVALPGANAAITALVGSGLPTDRFLFVGFLPKTEPKLVQVIKTAQTAEATLVSYESPQRLLKTMGYLSKYFADARIVVARELTKLHEEYLEGTPDQLIDELGQRQAIKGEITLLISFK